MVSLVTSKELEQTKELWMLGFGDGPEYTNFVFENLLEPDKILVYRENNRPVAMLCMEPMEIVSGDISLSGMYMYAFTVHPRYRGSGVGGELLEGFHKYLEKKKVAASVLTPADKELFHYYSKRGYQNQFAVRQLKVEKADLSPPKHLVVLHSRPLDMLYSMRNDFFGKDSGLLVRWRPSYLDFVTKETKLRNGEVLFVSANNQEGYLVYRKEENTATITEFAVPPEITMDALYALDKRIGALHYHLRLKADYPIEEQSMVLPFAMIRWYDRGKMGEHVLQAPYISHVMD